MTFTAQHHVCRARRGQLAAASEVDDSCDTALGDVDPGTAATVREKRRPHLSREPLRVEPATPGLDIQAVPGDGPRLRLVDEPGQARQRKRSAMEWATLLEELAAELGNGQFYRLDLPIIDEPIHRVAERYVRRRSE
jgi:hypothetical protein